MFALESCGMTQCVTQSALLLEQLYLEMLISMCHWSGLRSLACATLSIIDSLQDFSGLSCCWPCVMELLQPRICKSKPSMSSSR